MENALLHNYPTDVEYPNVWPWDNFMPDDMHSPAGVEGAIGPKIDWSIGGEAGVVNRLAHVKGPVHSWDSYQMYGHVDPYKHGLDTNRGGMVGAGDYGNAVAHALAQQGINTPTDEAIQAAIAMAL